MNQLEENVVNSFRLAKSDIIKIQSAVNALSRKQEELMEMISELKTNNAQLKEKVRNLSARVTDNRKAVAENVKRIQANKRTITRNGKAATKPKTVTKTRTVVKKVVVPARHKAHYVASKTGHKVHDMHCPFGKNIRPKMRVHFKSKTKALNEGFKLCDCLKKR